MRIQRYEMESKKGKGVADSLLMLFYILRCRNWLGQTSTDWAGSVLDGRNN